MMQTTGLRVYLLGPLRVELNTVRIQLSRRKVESLLAYLLLHPEQQSRDHLATLFWGDSTDAQARHSLRTTLGIMRQEISPDLLLADRDHVQINPDFPLWTDLHELLDLENDFDYANRELLQAYLALWQGGLLTGFYDEWITNEREHYDTRLLRLFLQVTQTLRARSEYGRAIEVAQRVLALDPANEHAHQHLMFCYVASGDRPAALRQYELCVRALLDDVDAPPLPETTALYQWIKQFTGEKTSSAGKITNLPIPLSTFIGRTRETAEVKGLLNPPQPHKRQGANERAHAVRLLTLMGAGGSGKTRLAIQVATDLIDSFAHGVWWVELAPLSDSDLVAPAIAKTLGVNEDVGQTVSQTIANFVGDQHRLLVMDNCEHVTEACALVAAELLAHCPNLQILATSREALNIAGEILWYVPTFAVPDLTKLTVVDLLLQFESLRLFVERAATVRPGFTLTLENAQSVVEICHRLDGIPLAIELAAARVKVLTVEQIAAYLTRALGARFDLLTQGSRAAMPRHQTLRATVDWSYNLLDDAERTLFCQVSIFRDGFTLDALEQLVSAGLNGARPPIPTPLDLLSQLVDKSLVIVEQHDGQNRYRLLETLREYGLEQLSTTHTLKELQQQHAGVFLRLADQAKPELLHAQQHAWLNRLETEHANLRATLEYLIAENDGERALRLAAVLQPFWEYRGYVSEGCKWLERALAIRETAPIDVVAKALNAAGRLTFRQGDLTYARRLHQEALFLSQQAESEMDIADSLHHLSTIELNQGDYGPAQQHLEQGLLFCRALNYELGVARALSNLGSLAWDQDRFTDACLYHLESLEIYKRLKMPVGIAYASLTVGDAERMLGNLDAARTHYEECQKIAHSIGHRGLVGASLKSMGLLAYKQKEYEQARHYGSEALQIFRELGDKIHAGFSLSNLGSVAFKLGENNAALTYFSQYLQIMVEAGYKWPTFDGLEDIAEILTDVEQHTEVAVHFLGAAAALRDETGIAVAENSQEKYERVTTTLRQKLGDERFDWLWQVGMATPLDQIVSKATSLSLT